MKATVFTFCKYIQFKSLEQQQSHSHGNIVKSHGFYRFLLQSVDQFNFIFFKVYFFTQPLHKASVVQAKIMSFYSFFFVANRIGSDTSQKFPNESPPLKLFQLARDLFILIDFGIICIHLRNTQPPISLKINAAFLIRITLAIILTNLLKQHLTSSSNTF